MNDRAVSVLEKYDIEVLRSWKGRGAILCETKTGTKILKEYRGSSRRLEVQKSLLETVRENGYPYIEGILPAKEGELLVRDEEMTCYYLKDYVHGRECNSKELSDCEAALKQLALYHRTAVLPGFAEENNLYQASFTEELEKHNRELRKIRKYLREKGQKTEFELILSVYYEFFQKKAEKILEEKKKRSKEDEEKKTVFCHGDFQHHNFLFSQQQSLMINFERFTLDGAARDISLFFRKIMEKNGWSSVWGERLLASYEGCRPLTHEEKLDLYYRLAYPEKFWKIVNFYYNSGKAWIPAKNLEKLNKLLKQEEVKERYLQECFMRWVMS